MEVRTWQGSKNGPLGKIKPFGMSLTRPTRYSLRDINRRDPALCSLSNNPTGRCFYPSDTPPLRAHLTHDNPNIDKLGYTDSKPCLTSVSATSTKRVDLGELYPPTTREERARIPYEPLLFSYTASLSSHTTSSFGHGTKAISTLASKIQDTLVGSSTPYHACSSTWSLRCCQPA